MRQFHAKLSGLSFLEFFIIGINIRAFAAGNYLVAGATDFLIAFVGFALIQKIAESKNWRDRFIYACSGTLGTLVAIYITKWV